MIVKKGDPNIGPMRTTKRVHLIVGDPRALNPINRISQAHRLDSAGIKLATLDTHPKLDALPSVSVRYRF